MRPFKITEIKVTAGKDVISYEPKSCTWSIAGKPGALDEKTAAKLFQAIAKQAEGYFELFKTIK
jgi:hypothetical protein